MRAAFQRYIGIDYSGAETPESSLPGLRVYEARQGIPATEVAPPPSQRRYFTRREIAEWLLETLSTGTPTVVGIDHGFSFPLQYFQKYDLPLDWPLFLDDFRFHWPTDEAIYVEFVRDGLNGNGAARSGSSRWRRIAELRVNAKSVFHFDVPGSVAKSTHGGLPWLRYIRQKLGHKVHFWPFDGWNPPSNVSVIAEAYPALCSRNFPSEGRTRDQHDAFSVCEWMRQEDARGTLSRFFLPSLSTQERETASGEGWILGVM